MPKEAQYTVPISAFGRLAVKSHNSLDNPRKDMPVNTRSMQRLSSTPQGPSSQMRPGASRGNPQYSVHQSTIPTTGTSNDSDESSDEDTEDEDDNDEEEEGGAGNESDDGSDSESDDGAGKDDPESEVRQMFAIAEPSGLVPAELERNQAGINGASTRVYRNLLDVVAAEATRNERFLDDLKAAVRVPSGEWSMLMYLQLRTRLETTMTRFDQNPRAHDVINTATQLKSLIIAINSMIQPDHWQVMGHITRQQYFGLLLDLLRGVVDRHPQTHSDRARHSQGSRSGTPYVTETGRDISLYEQMKDTPGALLLHRLFDLLQTNGLDARQKEHVALLYRAVEQRSRLGGVVVNRNSPDPTQDFVGHLRYIHAEITGVPGSSRGSRSSRSS